MLKKRFLADLEREKNPNTNACKLSSPLPPCLPKPPSSPPPEMVSSKNLFHRVPSGTTLSSHPTSLSQRQTPISSSTPPKQQQHSVARHMAYEKPTTPKPQPTVHREQQSKPEPAPFSPKVQPDWESEPVAQFNEQGERLYCLCRKPYNPQAFMIGCDECDDWFHSRCVKIAPSAAKSLEKYVCPRCTKKKSKLKRKAEAISEGKDNKEVSKKSCPSPSRPLITPLPSSVSVETHEPPAESPFEARDADPSENLMNVPSSSERRDSDSVSSSPQADSPNAIEVTAADSKPSSPISSAQDPKTTVQAPERTQENVQKPITDTQSPAIAVVMPRQRPMASPDNFSRPHALSPSFGGVTPLSPSMVAFTPLDEEPAKPDEQLLEEVLSKQADLSRLLDQIDKKTEILKQAIKNATDAPQKLGLSFCGCPTDKSLLSCDSFCQTPAHECVLHAHWQSLLKSDLVQERILQEKSLRRLRLEENVLRLKINQTLSS